ncbi:MAG: hypothetical protein KDE53_33590, partial [Caldilineaceae bacterium]|nr:hypothetical protein [Caldilineaceae bacterium]
MPYSHSALPIRAGLPNDRVPPAQSPRTPRPLAVRPRPRTAHPLTSRRAVLSNGCAPLTSHRATRTIAAKLCSTSSAVVAHEETLIRIAARPCQTVPPHQQVPS